MLTEEQKLTLEQSVRDVLQDFDQSGTAFTASTLVSALRESGMGADERLLDEPDIEAFVTDVVTRRRDELDGGPRQIVGLEIEPEQTWGFKKCVAVDLRPGMGCRTKT